MRARTRPLVSRALLVSVLLARGVRRAWVIGSLCGILATLNPHATAFQNLMVIQLVHPSNTERRAYLKPPRPAAYTTWHEHAHARHSPLLSTHTVLAPILSVIVYSYTPPSTLYPPLPCRTSSTTS